LINNIELLLITLQEKTSLSPFYNKNAYIHESPKENRRHLMKKHSFAYI